MTGRLLTANSEKVPLTRLISDVIEGLPIEHSFSPLLHRIQAAIRYRAVHPNDPILEPSERLTKFSQPDDDLVEKTRKDLEKLMAAADVKKGELNINPILCRKTNKPQSSTEDERTKAPARDRKTSFWPGHRRTSQARTKACPNIARKCYT